MFGGNGFLTRIGVLLLFTGVTGFAPALISHKGIHTPPPSTTKAALLPQHRTSQSHAKCVWPLFSLRELVQETIQSDDRQTILVGGKGGVGKTSVSAALAVQLAARDQNVLVVSTDPAHSLGDALDMDLRSAEGLPVTSTDTLTNGRLHAVEISAEVALRDFREDLASFDVDRLAVSLGVSPDLLESLGLKEFNGLLQNPPPGLDELVALSSILDRPSDEYDIIVVDTAPTGHTLRLLAMPQFLDGLLGKLVKLHMKLSGLTSMLQGFFGDSGAQERAQTLDDAMDRLASFRERISKMEERLKDKSLTSFLLVTVPTKLAMFESKRLLKELAEEGVHVSHMVVNQCVGRPGGNSGEADGKSMLSFYNRRVEGQQTWISRLAQAADYVSGSEEYQANGVPTPIAISELPLFDVELVGVPALGYIGVQHLAENPHFAHLMEKGRKEVPKTVICGGKGGVGKTTTSSSLAIAMAAQGQNVALISTDPAHSLGDAVEMDLSGGELKDCPLIGVPTVTTGEGSLSAMEIDPASALREFKSLVDQLVGSSEAVRMGGSDILGTLNDLEGVFDTLPAGTDEVVALAKIVKLIKNGSFDAIVLDTAPTGHTLRMLKTPGFLADVIDRLLAIAEKISSNGAVQMFLATTAGQDMASMESAAAAAKSKLLTFQLQMYDLEDLFTNPDQTEFLVVTVPTELAVRESSRLLNDLTFESSDLPIKVRNIVVNQVLTENGQDMSGFLTRVSDVQMEALREFRLGDTSTSPLRTTSVRYLDSEPRGIWGLNALGEELLEEGAVSPCA